MLINQKYLKNFKRHRNKIFLAQKIFFHKFTNDESNIYLLNLKKKEIFEILKIKKQTYKKKNSFPLNESLKNLSENFVEKKSFNFDKFVNFLNIANVTNRINYNFFIDFLLKFFKYSYLTRFCIEFIIILAFLIYFFKTGTFY